MLAFQMMSNKVVLIFLCLIFASFIDSFVVTTYDQSTIGTYYQKFKQLMRGNGNYVFVNKDLSKFCQSLRESMVFEIKGTGISRFVDGSELAHKIDEESLEMESKQLNIGGTHLFVQNSMPNEFLPTIKCLNRVKKLGWFVTSAFLPDTAFLFTFTSSLDNLFKQRQHLPRLIAIIDEAATFPAVTEFTREFLEEYLQSYVIAEAEGYGNRDRLCDLHSVMKYRLCAIGADALKRVKTVAVDNVDPLSNSYDEPETPDRSCSTITVYATNDYGERTEITRDVLYCSVTLGGNHRSFYLSLNMLNKKRAFVLPNAFNIRNTPTGTITTEPVFQIKVPLLKYLPPYTTVLQD